MEEDLLALSGTHNLYNSLASGIASKLVDIHDENLRASLSDFTGVEHRLEKVARVRGVDYINDSKATNVNSCWYALQSMTTPLVLILGGTDKGNDYSEIEELVKKKVHALDIPRCGQCQAAWFLRREGSCYRGCPFDGRSRSESV